MVCFTNVLDSGKILVIFVCACDRWVKLLFIGFQEGNQYKRSIALQFSVGAEAADYQKVVNAENLNPLEAELRKLETVVKEIVDEMNYLKAREAKLRDTNGNYSHLTINQDSIFFFSFSIESTNERVKWFSTISLFTLFGLGTWQILYLRRFFKRKRLID